MPRTSTWKNVPGEAQVCATVVIAFESTGYDDPGRIGGNPENDYPPEGGDERTVTGAYIEAENGERLRLSKGDFDRIAELFAADIAAAEIDTAPDYDGD